MLDWLKAEDVRLFRDVYGVHESALAGVMVVLSTMGGGGGVIAIAPLLAPKRTRAFALSLAGVLVVTSIVVAVLKRVVGRGRPLLLPGVHAIGLPPHDDPSFPSGHAAGSFAFALFVAVVLLAGRPRSPLAYLAVASAFVFAFAVAFSRVYLGFHYPIDVACGAILGGALGALAGRIHAHRL